MTLNKLAKKAYLTAKKKGFWKTYDEAHLTSYKEALISQKLQLISDEVSEAHEELRKGMPIKYTNPITGMKDALVYGSGVGTKPEGLGVELADVLIRTLDLMYMLGVDVDATVEEKMVYNSTRPAKHGKRF